MKQYGRQKNNLMIQNQNNRGFTLIEIMSVVVIIGFLVMLGIPIFTTMRNTTLEKTIVSDARLIGTAIQQVAMESGDLICDLTFTPGAPGAPGAAMTWQVHSENGAIYPGRLSQCVSGINTIGLNVNDGTFILTHAQYNNANTNYTNAKSRTDSLIFTAEGVPVP